VAALLGSAGTLCLAVGLWPYARLASLKVETDAGDPRTVRLVYTPLCSGKLSLYRRSRGRRADESVRVRYERRSAECMFEWTWHDADPTEDRLRVTYRQFLWLRRHCWRGALKPLGNGVVTGTVAHADSGLPIGGADVTVRGTWLRATTDNDGRFRIVHAPMGPQTIAAVVPGFTSSEQRCTVAEKQTVSVKLVISQRLARRAGDNRARTRVAFERIDKHASNTPKRAERSVESLAAYLVRPATGDREKARAIYRWITHNIVYDTEAFFERRSGDARPESVLKTRRCVCAGYANLFKSLGEAAGLEVVRVTGQAKGYGHSPGAGLTEPIRHAWNAVRIDGAWHLVDATWGAGYIDENGKFVNRFNEHYFMTKPEYMIYMHFPETPKWQLLERPISLREFEQLPHLTPGFFDAGLAVCSHPAGVIHAEDRVDVTFHAAKDALLRVRLERGDQKLPESLAFAQRSNDLYRVSVVFPGRGDYILRLWGERRGSTESGWCSGKYKIVARKGAKGRAGFPETYGAFTRSNVYLHSPMEGHLKSGTTRLFKVQVPGATDVAAVVNGKWLHLERSGETFEGRVRIERQGVVVAAKFPGETTFTWLLRYVGF